MSMPKLWYWAARDYWCASIGGKRKCLSKNRREAQLKLKAIVEQESGDGPHGPSEWLDATFAELADAFADDYKARKSEKTAKCVLWRLQTAISIMGGSLKVSQVRKHHLATIETELRKREWAGGTIRDTIANVQQVFNWAVEHEHLFTNPLTGYRKPAGRGRTRIVTEDEFRKLLRAAAVSFRILLVAIRATGCRPKEVRTLRWQDVDLEQALWIVWEHKTVGAQSEPRPRVVPLSPRMVALCSWLQRTKRDGQEYLFMNRKGKPWTKNAVVLAMRRTVKRAGIESKAGEPIVPYSLRHSFATDAVGKVSDIELAELMGHSTTRTTRRYVHINAARLKDIQRRATKRENS